MSAVLHEVMIEAAPPAAPMPRDGGFEWMAHRSFLTEWTSFLDGALVRTFDHPEVAAALQAQTRADRVEIIDHLLYGPSLRTVGSVAALPAGEVEASSLQSVNSGAIEAARRGRRRWALVGYWRIIGGPAWRKQVAALCRIEDSESNGVACHRAPAVLELLAMTAPAGPLRAIETRALLTW
jgi:hypothetical protein